MKLALGFASAVALSLMTNVTWAADSVSTTTDAAAKVVAAPAKSAEDSSVHNSCKCCASKKSKS